MNILVVVKVHWVPLVTSSVVKITRLHRTVFFAPFTSSKWDSLHSQQVYLTELALLICVIILTQKKELTP